jgi:hypothetical protein
VLFDRVIHQPPIFFGQISFPEISEKNICFFPVMSLLRLGTDKAYRRVDEHQIDSC